MNLADSLAQMPRQKALIIGLVVGLLYYLIGYDDGEQYIAGANRMEQQIQDAQNKIKGIDRRLERAEKYKETIDLLGGRMEKFVSYIPQEFSSMDLMRILSKEAKAAGTNIIRISESRSARQSSVEFYDQLSVQMELEGTYGQFVLFLSYLTKLEKIITVNDLKITNQVRGGGGDQQSPVLGFSAVVSGYRYKGAEKE